MTETVLVTGGSGFIGGWCIVELLRRGYNVRSTLRSLDKVPAVRAAIAGEVDSDTIDWSERLSFFAATLTNDAGWDEAVAGCDYVLHVASPLGTDRPRTQDDLIIPARDGALRALRAAAKAGVKRVVMTSSVSASSPEDRGPDGVSDEHQWTPLAGGVANAYPQSKMLAERAAWEFAKANPGTELVTILPSLVLGPVLTPDNLGSVQVVSRLMAGKVPGIPRIGFTLVDVRDVADAHIRAMTLPEAAGQRFIIAAEWRWLGEIAAVLRDRLGAKAAKVTARKLPDFVLRLAALFDPGLKLVVPGLGRRHGFTSAKAQHVLGWTPRDVDTTIAECGESLVAKGAV